MSGRESDELFPFLPGRWSAAFVVAFLGICIATSFVVMWVSVDEPLRGSFAWVLAGFFSWVGAMTLQRRAGLPGSRRPRRWWPLAYGLGIAAAGAFVLGRAALGAEPIPGLLAAVIWTTLTTLAPPKPEAARLSIEADQPVESGS
ncbi:hypothetical protein [Rubrivirga sp. IMCC43871]|uniref:hypothetical protein n=1 Tax=Rubrivirga sp. IMCC43871 TaxID=3391575 RepID=UPI0039901B7B